MKCILVFSNIELLNADQVNNLLSLRYPDKTINCLIPDEGNYPLESVKKFINSISTKVSNISEKIIHVFINGNKLSHIVQNLLLKTLEETNHNIVILVSNPDILLPTVRSRMLVEYINQEDSESESVGDLNSKKITELAKDTRENVIKYLTMKINEISNTNSSKITDVLVYQDMIDKIKANCKIEAVLIDGLYRLNN